jgi:hypothetical protein
MKFQDQLADINYATKTQIQEEHWHIEGIIKSRSNQKLKFDLSPIIKFNNDDYGKIGHFKSKSDKIVFDFKNTWILIDTSELHDYIKETNKKDLNIDELLQELSWNIILDK